jgi:hypothetical protein
MFHYHPITQFSVHAQDLNPYYYETGNPILKKIYVNPTSGNDNNSGNAPNQAFRTINRAWNMIPMNQQLQNSGYLIQLASGSYGDTTFPHYWESRKGTASFPIIINGPKTAILRGHVNIYNCDYLYMIGFTIDTPTDVLHCELCDHFLLRSMTLKGRSDGSTYENVKINQSQYVYIEKCTLSGAYDNVIDYVAVQYGHIVQNQISGGGDWCAYVKGGSSYLRIEGNVISDCGTGGFTAGQGTGFEFMTTPWLHYEAYDIKFFNNIIHDTYGACFGVNGGYNVLFAYNTCYRVGERSHVLEVVFGLRSCDGNTAKCNQHLSQGGWGTSGNTEQPIPNQNVRIMNNVVYNPSGYQSQWQHFAIHGPRNPSSGSNIPNPARTDTGLIIQGNIIWNGPAVDLSFLGPDDDACTNSNPTCNTSQLLTDNKINAFATMSAAPNFRDPTSGDFRPQIDGSIVETQSYSISSFTNVGRPSVPSVPPGVLTNNIPRDFSSSKRTLNGGPPGAYAKATSPIQKSKMKKFICARSLSSAKKECPYRSTNCSGRGSSCGDGKTCFRVTCY